MVKSLIARMSRWICRVLSKFRTSELDKHAKGLAECLVPPPPTKKQKEVNRMERLLHGVADTDRDKVIGRLRNLDKEIDPLENTSEIPNDSVKKVGIDISEEDLKDGFIKEDEHDVEKRVRSALSGYGQWPITYPGQRKHRKRKK